MGIEETCGHLCPGDAHLNETLIDHLQKTQELLVLIVKAASEDNRTDDVGHSAAQEEGGIDGGTCVANSRDMGCGITQWWV
jgi:hypothetical protein